MKSGRDLVAEIRSLLRRKATYETILKWNPTQPRNPAGSTGGGRWAKGHGLASIAPGHQEFPSAAGSFAARSYQARQRGGFTSIAPGMSRQQGEAGYADIMNAPTGTGFTNRPRGVNLPELPKAPVGSLSPEKEKTIDALLHGTAKDSRPLGSGGNANASVIVTLDDGTEAVYKPERGENWTAHFCNSHINRYITNRDFSLAEREAFAFEVDTALGLGLVPETVLREKVDETHIDVNTSGDDEGGGGGGEYDSYEMRELYGHEYEQYKEKAQEQAMEDVGGEMHNLYLDAQQEHVKDIENRAQELTDIWNEEVKDFPDSPYGSGSALGEHPVLPLGSKTRFERRRDKDTLDPLEVLDEAGVDVSAAMSDEEKAKVREVVRQRLEEGYQQLGDVDREQAEEHLDRDRWIDEHQDTEARMYESKVKSFNSWLQSQGYSRERYDSGGGSGGGSGEDRNPDAPHPQGGSFQNYRDGADSWGDLDEENGAKLAVLDYVIGTMDRHPGNLMFEDGKPVAIDNGYSMPAADKGEDRFNFRSHGVQDWYNSGENVPADLRATLHDAVTKMDWKALVARHPSMNEEERAAFLGRVENMKIALQTEEGLRELWDRQKLVY